MATSDRPWVMRTYAGHSSAAESNALYRRNLAKGQTGLSVAFDLPTQTGYDPDHPLAQGEVGKVGVPVAHLGDMRALFDRIPLAQMNTSMTINATAMWLLALYQVAARGAGRRYADELTGTTQNDIVKEYLSRGTYVVPAGRVAAAHDRHDRVHGRADAEVEPDQHLQLPPAGGGRDAGAGARLRAVARRSPCSIAVRDGGQVPPDGSATSSAGSRSSSTRACGSSRRCARCARSSQLWDQLTLERYGVDRPEAAALPLRRAGQLAGTHRGAAREQRAADRARDARRDAVEGRAGARGAAAGVERGARPAAAVGPAVVAADAAGARLRVRPARVRRHLRRLARDRGQGRRAGRRARERDRPGTGDGRCGRSGRERVHEAGAGRVACRTSRSGSSPASRSWSG